MLSSAELEEEIVGSERDVAPISDRVEIIRFNQTKPDDWMTPYTVQVIYDIHFKEPPNEYVQTMEDGDEKKKLESASRHVRVAMCLPHGYALMENGDSSSSAPSYRLTSPIQMKSSLNALLLACSPVYSTWFDAQMWTKMNALAAEQEEADE